jgi:hypothetical protein
MRWQFLGLCPAELVKTNTLRSEEKQEKLEKQTKKNIPNVVLREKEAHVPKSNTIICPHSMTYNIPLFPNVSSIRFSAAAQSYHL